MNNATNYLSTRQVIAYWLTTGLLAIVVIVRGSAQLVGATFMTDGFQHLGYPIYLTRILGTWKILGGLILLIPAYGLVKEWAYAGFFFLLSGAVISHIVSGDAFGRWASPFICLLLTIASWSLRPANRRLTG